MQNLHANIYHTGNAHECLHAKKNLSFIPCNPPSRIILVHLIFMVTLFFPIVFLITLCSIEKFGQTDANQCGYENEVLLTFSCLQFVLFIVCIHNIYDPYGSIHHQHKLDNVQRKLKIR
jgi:hypothetical protein